MNGQLVVRTEVAGCLKTRFSEAAKAFFGILSYTLCNSNYQGTQREQQFSTGFGQPHFERPPRQRLRAGCRSFGAKLRPPPPPVGSRPLFRPCLMTYDRSLSQFRPALGFALLALLIVGTERFVTRLPVFALRPVLPLAVVVDVLVGIPLLFYFMVVCRYRLPASTVAPVVATCLALTYWLLPTAQQAPLEALRWLPAGLELATLAVLVVRGRRLLRAFRAAGTAETQFLPRARTAVEHALGPVGKLLVIEIDMLRYATVGWWARPEMPAAATAFSSHRESGFPAIVAVVGFALLIEAATVHLLVSYWNATVANWLLLFEGYGLLLLVAHGHAVRLRPTLVTAERVVVRVGFFWHLNVPRAEVVAVEVLTGDLAPAPETLRLAKPVFAAPNLLLTFAGPVTVTGPYGIRRRAHRVALYLDQPTAFALAAAGYSDSPTR